MKLFVKFLIAQLLYHLQSTKRELKVKFTSIHNVISNFEHQRFQTLWDQLLTKPTFSKQLLEDTHGIKKRKYVLSYRGSKGLESLVKVKENVHEKTARLLVNNLKINQN